MSLAQSLLQLAQQSGAKDLPVCEKAVEDAAVEQRSMVNALLETGQVDEKVFAHKLGESLGLPVWEGEIPPIPAPLREKFPARIALRHRLLPVTPAEGGALPVLCFDPYDHLARQALAGFWGGDTQWMLAPRRAVLDGLRGGYGVGAETFDEILEAGGEFASANDLEQETTILDENDSEASVIKFVNQIIREALQERATDIHIEPLEDDLQVRYRIDGVLRNIPVPPRIKLFQASLISRIKIMAHLDIAERRLPQDGRINLEFEGRPIDVRIATIPSVTGESISLRLLGQQRFDFAQMGLSPLHEASVRNLLALPNGIVLITGPTGSGKSTTLYTFLASLNTKDRRIVTIEDPVENKIPGVVQIAVKPEINLTFAAGLRSILRGDPNVVMVGEMRDVETTEIAIRAALTGHLVFSTLHTNDAIGGITRLVDMGIEPFLVGSSVRAFIAQRLVRVLCPWCCEPATYSEQYLKDIGIPLEKAATAHRAVGCDRCRQTGYQGRRAIFEICLVTPLLQEMITAKATNAALKEAAKSQGMRNLRDDGWDKVAEGTTTIEEVLRVTVVDASKNKEN
jgi:general secretion pathway protein E